ncbi:hypothetical protein I4U23_006532 [Adineta vaga]|nr:hypothetical protein I4U23_006532 [Adineta vaga]
MHAFNRLRSKIHHDSHHQTKTTSSLSPPPVTTRKFTTHSDPSTSVNTNNTTPTQSISISAPIIDCRDKVIIIDKDQSNESPNEEQISVVDDDNIDVQIISSEKTEKMSGECTHRDDQVD